MSTNININIPDDQYDIVHNAATKQNITVEQFIKNYIDAFSAKKATEDTAKKAQNWMNQNT